jgi:hypothetical protein
MTLSLFVSCSNFSWPGVDSPWPGADLLSFDRPMLRAKTTRAEVRKTLGLVAVLSEVRNAIDDEDQPSRFLFSFSLAHEAAHLPRSIRTRLWQPESPEERRSTYPWLADTVDAPWPSPNWQATDYGCLGAWDEAFVAQPDGAVFWVPAPGTGYLYPLYPYSLGLEADACAALLRFVDGIMAALRLMLVRVLAALSRFINAANLVLVIIAACLRFGHRDEPGDNDSLFARRYQSLPGTVPTS